MPLYEYECDRGHRFERIVKFSDPPIEACPECGAPVHKLMSSPAIQFKGTGWYITDYARKGEGKESKDAKAAKPAGESKESKETKETKETTTEKPAATETPKAKKETATSEKSG
jgi:putative FmdB family regulatory protein